MGFIRDFLGNIGNPQPGKVVYGRMLKDLPCKKLKQISQQPIATFCAPKGFLADIHQRVKKHRNQEYVEELSATDNLMNMNFNQSYNFADGKVLSLYEKSGNEDDAKLIGDPIADSLAIITCRDTCILALADGVSWGQKSRLASTCSIYGSVTYLNQHLASCKNTKDVFRCILKAFDNAQNCIVSEQGTMTTLCVAVVVPLQERGDRRALCVVNVGDSYAYVYNKNTGVKEITEGSHPIEEKRDMRQCGGALGPADGFNPDLGNLTYSFTMLEEGEIVFLCSDGVSDNFDPAVSKVTANDDNNESFDEISSELPSDEIKKNAPASSYPSGVLCDKCSEVNQPNTCEQLSENIDRNSLGSLHNITDSVQSNNDSAHINKTRLSKNNSDSSKYSNDSFQGNIVNPRVKELQESEVLPVLAKSESVLSCKQCGDKIEHEKINHHTSSVLDFNEGNSPKFFTSLSFDEIKAKKTNNANAEKQGGTTRPKSNSFTMAGEQTNSGAEHEKDTAISMLKSGSSVTHLNSYPNIDFWTGMKCKQDNTITFDSMDARQRREGALKCMTQVINRVEPSDEGVIDVGEVCSQVISFITQNTQIKRNILERVPQSELESLTRKERKQHNESVRKELQGVPGKLDHASIVCYEVGTHGDIINTTSAPLSIDRYLSAPGTVEGEQLPSPKVNTESNYETTKYYHQEPQNIKQLYAITKF